MVRQYGNHIECWRGGQRIEMVNVIRDQSITVTWSKSYLI
jgi:hypothetical protein